MDSDLQRFTTAQSVIVRRASQIHKLPPTRPMVQDLIHQTPTLQWLTHLATSFARAVEPPPRLAAASHLPRFMRIHRSVKIYHSKMLGTTFILDVTRPLLRVICLYPSKQTAPLVARHTAGNWGIHIAQGLVVTSSILLPVAAVPRFNQDSRLSQTLGAPKLAVVLVVSFPRKFSVFPLCELIVVGWFAGPCVLTAQLQI